MSHSTSVQELLQAEASDSCRSPPNFCPPHLPPCPDPLWRAGLYARDNASPLPSSRGTRQPHCVVCISKLQRRRPSRRPGLKSAAGLRRRVSSSTCGGVKHRGSERRQIDTCPPQGDAAFFYKATTFQLILVKHGKMVMMKIGLSDIVGMRSECSGPSHVQMVDETTWLASCPLAPRTTPRVHHDVVRTAENRTLH